MKIQETKTGREYIKLKNKRVYLKTLLKRANKARLKLKKKPLKKITKSNIEKIILMLMDKPKFEIKKPTVKRPRRGRRGRAPKGTTSREQIEKMAKQIEELKKQLQIEKDKDKIEQLEKTLKETQEAEKEQRLLLKDMRETVDEEYKEFVNTFKKDIPQLTQEKSEEELIEEDIIGQELEEEEEKQRKGIPEIEEPFDPEDVKTTFGLGIETAEELRGMGIIQKVIDFTHQIFKGRDKLGGTSQKRLDKFGDEYIKSVYITRKPIMKGIKVMANLLTNGKFEKDMLKHGFDDLFHLALNIELENGVCLTIQKNETVYIDRGCNYNKDEPDLQVQKVFRRGRIKLKDAYENMRRGYKNDREVYDYDSASNNCQRFVDTFLKQNQRAFHYGKKEKDFTVQQIDPLLKKYSKLQKASKAITDLAQRLSLFLTGGATEEQEGGMIDQEEDALTNTEIEKIMSRYKNFLGVSPVNTGYKLLHMVKPKSNGGMIYNLDKEGERGSHWVALYWDAKGNKPSICYYDSFGRDIPNEIEGDIKQIVKILDCDKHMKLKINRKVNQDKKSVSCGYLCCLFLMDLFRGKSFKSATGFNVKQNEDRAEELQEKFDYIL